MLIVTAVAIEKPQTMKVFQEYNGTKLLPWKLVVEEQLDSYWRYIFWCEIGENPFEGLFRSSYSEVKMRFELLFRLLFWVVFLITVNWRSVAAYTMDA